MAIKRITALLLAFTMVLVVLPWSGLSAPTVVIAQAANTDYDIDQPSKTMTINNAAGWKWLSDNVYKTSVSGLPGGLAGWTVKLANDILLPNPLPSVDDFRGVFDGQGNTISIPPNSCFSNSVTDPTLGPDVGLFRNLVGSAEVKNLVVRLDGVLKIAANSGTYNVPEHRVSSFGAVVGKMEGSSKLTNCALLDDSAQGSDALVLYRNNISDTRLVNTNWAAGSMVGTMTGNTVVSGCFSEAAVETSMFSAVIGNSSSFVVWANAGGIVGYATDKSQIISDCMYYNATVEVKHLVHGSSRMGAIVGSGGTIRSCYNKGPTIVRARGLSIGQRDSAAELDLRPIGSYMGVISGVDSAIDSSTCFSNAALDNASNEWHEFFNNEGSVGLNGKTSAQALGNNWIDTMAEYPNLRWMVSPPPESNTIDVAGDKLTIKPAYLEYEGNTVYTPHGDWDYTGDSLWKITATVPIKGRTDPFAGKLTQSFTDKTNGTVKLLDAPKGTNYYYALPKDANEITVKIAQTYTSVAKAAPDGFSIYDPTAGIPFTISANAINNPDILIMAVTDTGNMLPSKLSHYTLKLPPAGGSEPVPMPIEIERNSANTPAGGYPPRSYNTRTAFSYSDTLEDDAAAVPPTDGIPLTALLQKLNSDERQLYTTTDYVATGTIQLKICAAHDKMWSGEMLSFIAQGDANQIKGEIAPMPTIYPRDGGVITSSGITITVPDKTATIFYTAVADSLAPVFPEVTVDEEAGTAVPKPGSVTKKYDGNSIPFPVKGNTFAVRAVAWLEGKSISEADYVLYKNTENLVIPGMPSLLVSGVAYSASSTYPDSSTLVFQHVDLANGTVYFTVNGDDPNSASVNTYQFRATGGNGTTIFDGKDHLYKLPSNRESITVKAKFYDENKKLESPVASFIISTKQKLKAPAASERSGTKLNPGQQLFLSPSDAMITQLNSNKVSVSRTKYTASIDSKASLGMSATDGDPVITGEKPIEGTEYITYNVNDKTSGYLLPDIRYLFGDSSTDIENVGISCKYGQRKVLTNRTTTQDKDGNYITKTTVSVNYVNPEPLVLTDALGAAIKLHTIALSTSEEFSNSVITTFTYSTLSKAAKPTATPITSSDAIAVLRPKSIINLSSVTSDSEIYYTTDNTQTNPDDYLNWVKNNKPNPPPSTMLYDSVKGIVMPSDIKTFFTVRAVTRSKNASYLNSDEAQFIYQPPAPVQAVFASPTAGAVVANQSVMLKCSTPDTQIFYRIFTQEPDMTLPSNIPEPYKDQIFDSKAPIAITKETWIVAIGEKEGITSIPMLYHYTVASTLRDPTSSLKTGSVVYKGTRIRLSANGNIAFTIDGSDPKAGMAAMQAVPPPTGKDIPAVFYGDSLVIDGDYGKSLTVRAFCYEDGKTPSNTVSFTYTVCDKDSYLVAAPPAGSVVTVGDTITLTTGISGGMVFYATGSSIPTVVNRFDGDREHEWDDPYYDDDYDFYEWRSGKSTRKSNSAQVAGEPGSTFTIKVTAAANGSEGGAVQVFTYNIRAKTSSPTASIPNGAVTLEDATVVLTAQEGDIFYTTDGTQPTSSSQIYSKPIPVTGSMVLKTIALAKDKIASDVAEYHYSYADQVFAPSMSLASGEIEQGSQITLTSETEGASIYYTTNGAEPSDSSALYSGPITAMRPVTIKTIAVKKGMRNSAINSAAYTVVEPPPPETEDGDSDKPTVRLDSLVSRRTYFSEDTGTKFTDVVIHDGATNTVLSADEDVVPKSAKLIVKPVATSDSDQEAVGNISDYQIVQLYDVSLEQDGVMIQPQGEVEIGIPIPSEYQNSIVSIYRVGSDNTVEEFEPRRSGSNAYITVQGNLDRYAVTVPKINSDKGMLNIPKELLLYGGIMLTVGGVGILAVRIIKKRRKAKDDD